MCTILNRNQIFLVLRRVFTVDVMESKSNHRYQKIERSEREDLGFAKIQVGNRYKILILVFNIHLMDIKDLLVCNNSKYNL